MRKIVVGISGASCMPVARRLVQILSATPSVKLGCIVSEGAEVVWREECKEDLASLETLADMIWEPTDFTAAPASGTWWDPISEMAMVVVPCSMGTLGALAAGYCANLVHRAGDVVLKEGGRLVLVTRETPLSSIHLQNMLTLRQAGAVIMPFSPGFYLHPRTLEDLIEQFCCRILDQIGVAHPGERWEDDPPF